jgi:hypothetical protein
MLVPLALPGLAFGSGPNRLRFGDLEVEFISIQWIDEEPLAHPTRLLKVEGNRLTLGDGRLVEVKDASRLATWMTVIDTSKEDLIVDVTTGLDDSVTIHMLQSLYTCGTASTPTPPSVIRIPTVGRKVYRMHRVRMATGRVVGTVPGRGS